MSDLIVEDVTKEFPSSRGPLVVLRGVSLQLSAGENLAVLGPSGSGKSTLLHVVGGLDRPTSGRVALDGIDPAQLSEVDLADFRNHRIGFIFQDHHLLPQCSVRENVLIPAMAGGPLRTEHLQRADELIERVGLADRTEHRPAELSGGERQRVAIARALVQSPRLLLADEPTGNLDGASAATVGDLLLELQAAENTMMIVVTHSLELADRMQRRLEFEDGRLRESSPTQTPDK